MVDGQPKHNRLTEVAWTWSWASTKEEISFHNRYLPPEYNPLKDLLEVVSGSDIHIPGADREVEIKDAKDNVLRIRGRFYRSPGQQEADAAFRPYVKYDCKDAEQSGSDARIEYLPMYKSGPEEGDGHSVESLEGSLGEHSVVMTQKYMKESGSTGSVVDLVLRIFVLRTSKISIFVNITLS